MPAQDIELEQQKHSTIKLLNMEPRIPQNRSNQHLVSEEARGFRSLTVTEWVSVIILCFVNLINYMDRFTVAGILPDIQKYYDIGNAEGGLLQTVFILSYMFFAPLFGYLGDRYNRKIIMAFGVFLWSITTLLGSFMEDFWWFLACRACVGIGEASYSTIAPTIISDLFVKDVRSKMLAIFYFAIPVGSGLGYIVGSVTANLAGSWHWGLRVTPILGVVAVVLMLFVLKDPERGQSEGADHLSTTSWLEDIKDITRNRSFMYTTLAFTCVAFAAGALSWWGPTLLFLGIRLQPGQENITLNDISYIFGILGMTSGLLGVPAGTLIAQKLRDKHPSIDPLICAIGLIVSSPMIYFACILPSINTIACYIAIFLGQFFINLTWSLVADILLYVVVPTRRSTAEGFQLLFSHAFGDAGSPYLVGMISDILIKTLQPSSWTAGTAITGTSTVKDSLDLGQADVEFRSLQYAIFIACFVEILGGIFFLLCSVYVVKDRLKAEKAVKEAKMSHENMESNPDIPKTE